MASTAVRYLPAPSLPHLGPTLIQIQIANSTGAAAAGVGHKLNANVYGLLVCQ